MNHSPLPWKCVYNPEKLTKLSDKNNSSIFINHQDAEFIVKCVNSHYKLLSALKSACAALDGDEQIRYEFLDIIQKLERPL